MSVLSGVCAAVLTPLTKTLQPDSKKAAEYYKRLLDRGCDALNVLGTSGEAMSLSLKQRMQFMQALAESGLPVGRMMVGTGSSALAEAIELTRFADECGFAAALIMPPFYYRNIHDEGVLAYFDRLCAAVNPKPGGIYLYNFPQASGITFTTALVARLMSAYPGLIGGLKDSSNDLPFVQELASVHPELAIFPSSEAHLLFARDHGLAGCVSGTVALWPQLAGQVWSAERDLAQDAQRRLSILRNAVPPAALIGAVRKVTALQEADESWTLTLPPLRALTRAEFSALEAHLLADAATCKATT
ncbi:MAG: dihydrodipicolinate synthase family protein [Vulcanimicrobiaceae bacterium]